MGRGNPIRELEETWGRYKYLVLEKSAPDYNRIRQLLKDKQNPPVEEFHRVLQQALAKETTTGGFVNAAQHVWGYFKKDATQEERRRFAQAMERVQQGEGGQETVKALLHHLATKYGQTYLLDSHYFDHDTQAEGDASP